MKINIISTCKVKVNKKNKKSKSGFNNSNIDFGSFNFLADEPEIYSITDIKKKYV